LKALQLAVLALSVERSPE